MAGNNNETEKRLWDVAKDSSQNNLGILFIKFNSNW